MSCFSRDFWNSLNEAQANGEFLYSSENRTTLDKNYVHRRIEDLIVRLLKDVSELTPPTLEFWSRNSWHNVYYVPGLGLRLKKNCSISRVSLCRGGSSSNFGLHLKVLSMIYRLLLSNQTATKRDLYYDDPKAFKNQAILNTIVDNISCMLGMPRHLLNVLATSKGCMAGDLQFSTVDGETVDCAESKSGVLVPAQPYLATGIASRSAKFIVVVEKDASFQRLLSENVTTILSCIMITGKGVPDVNTRQMTKILSDDLQIPVFGLFDADPYGIEIMCVYRFGSLSLSFDSANLAVSNMRWIGFLPSDLKRLNLPNQGMIPFSDRDARKCMDLIKRPYMTAHPKILQQVEQMTELRCKAELQAMSLISPSYLSGVYLPLKIKHGEWI